MSICGGYAYNADLKCGSIWGVDKTFCKHARGTLEHLIKDLYRQTTDRA